MIIPSVPYKFLQQRKVFVFFLLTLLLFSVSSIPLEVISTRQIISGMIASTGKVKCLKFKFKKKERIDDEIVFGEQDVKYNKQPFKSYAKLIAPSAGTEVLYVKGENDNKAYVNPNGFPYITLSLDPYGSSMRKNNHHTVNEIGFDYVTSIISFIAQKADKDFDKYFIYKGDTTFNNRKCYKILIDYTPFGYYNYTVKEGETLTKIAYKLYVSDYMILELNKDDVDDYDDVDAGDVIKVPNAYARKTVLCIDKETLLPLVQVMYDDKGLFGQYEFHNVQLNPQIPDEEFTKDYKGYHFK